MQIELKTYDTNEFKRELKITKWVWENRREELFDYLDKFFEIEIKKGGRSTYYIIKQQFGDYEPLPRQGKSQEIKDYYLEATREEVERNHWNTGSNIARRIVKNDLKNRFSHAEGTITNYVRPIIKDKFINEATVCQWMKLDKDNDEYLPLSEEQEEFLANLFAKKITANELGEKTMDIVAQVISGYMSKEEAGDAVVEIAYKTYMQTMSEFKAQFGFMPVKVKLLEERAF